MAKTTRRSWRVKFRMEIIVYMPANSIYVPAVTTLDLVRSLDIM
jgi:hypothetical protein